MKKVLYEELLPEECVQRIKEMPVAYLPLGTLEWHGPHMPLGADGIQSKELFVRVAEKVGGVVLPMLFMGPDRSSSGSRWESGQRNIPAAQARASASYTATSARWTARWSRARSSRI